MKRIVMVTALMLLVFLLSGTQAFYAGDEGLGPQSDQAKGELRVLAVAVRFPDTSPSFDLNNIRRRAVDNLDQYVREQSYGQAWLKADFRGWVDLPDPLSKYKVSPHNFKVDRTRVRKLIEDTLTGLGSDVDFSRYKHILIIPGVRTMPGEGYGMLCYCANPGMLTGVKGKLSFSTVRSRNGKEFNGGIFVGAENAHLGMFAHDFFHALGGIEEGKRLVP
jgi:M6 family metalloprotease-like protein